MCVQMAAYNSCVFDGGNVIDITGLEKSYLLGGTGVPILHGSDLCTKNGKLVAIMIPSGTGKNTLMNMIGWLDRLAEGKVTLMGRDTSVITGNEFEELRGIEIGFVFHNFNLIPRPSAYENVTLLAYSNAKKGADSSVRVRDLLNMVGLNDLPKVEFIEGVNKSLCYLVHVTTVSASFMAQILAVISQLNIMDYGPFSV
jgi:putative ABC transport system ATP-binding protein